MIFIFGHKNPDTDSVNSAIALSYLKNRLGVNSAPYILGSLNKETRYILDYFKISYPAFLKNVKTQIKDINYEQAEGVTPDSSILNAYKLMESNNLKTLPVLDCNKKLLGLVTMHDIAMELIKSDYCNLDTSFANIAHDLEGEIVVANGENVQGKISVIAYYYKTIAGELAQNDIIIVGDRYDIIEHAINSKVKLIIITGNNKLPSRYINLAHSLNVAIISVKVDTYTASKLINQCNKVSSIMKTKDLVRFNENDYLEDIKEEMVTTNFRNYPVLNNEQHFLGFIKRKHLLNPGKKKVILVDHNEYSQSAEGLHESEILEIVDHHKLGDISTSIPISFRNLPVGSTCTIVYKLFEEYDISIPQEIAGVLLAGIISDTLFFKSPTTTEQDKKAVENLNSKLGLDLAKFAMDMFKAGTSLEGYSIEEIFFKDFKEFTLDGQKTGMSQVFTLDIDEVFNRKDDFLNFISEVHSNKNYYLTLLLVTDILKEGSYLLYKCNNTNIISTAFQISNEQGVFVEALVSRKKQVVPKVIETISILS